MSILEQIKRQLGQLVGGSEEHSESDEPRMGEWESKESDRIKERRSSRESFSSSAKVSPLSTPVKSPIASQYTPSPTATPFNSHPINSSTASKASNTPVTSANIPNPYSNGFESIYALENVDVRTVRRMSTGKPAQSLESQELKLVHPDINESEELQLDFGEVFCGKMTPYRYLEPIQVLRLAAVSEKTLLEAGKRTVMDLIALVDGNVPMIKGLGQGHIDEIRQSLQKYLQGWSKKPSPLIDFCGLVRCLLGHMEEGKIWLCLEPFQLTHLFQLNPAKLGDVKRLNKAQREEAYQRVKDESTGENRKVFLYEQIKRLGEVFVKPWLATRQGFAQEQEIIEYLKTVSVQPSETAAIWAFLKESYFRGEFPLQGGLVEVEPGIFCKDSTVRSWYYQVLKRANSYFYSLKVDYALGELEIFLQREFGREWTSFADGFIRRVLRTSRDFSLQRYSGEVYIKKSISWLPKRGD